MASYQTLVEMILRARDEYSKEMKAYSGAARRAEKDTRDLTATGDRGALAFTRMTSGLKGFIGAGLSLTAVVAGVKSVFAEGSKVERQQLRLEGLVRATGGAAGFTARQLDDMARGLAEATLASTEGARDAIGVLLTFKNVTGDTFRQTLALSQDLAEVMGTDVKSAALQLAKALEDPNTGLTALRRSGVSFTEQEQEQIKALAEANRLLEAQGIILEKVSGQIGGAGAAAGQGLAGKLDLLGQRWGELKESLADTDIASRAVQGLVNRIEDATRALRPTLDDLTVRSINLREEIRQAEDRGGFWAIAVSNLRAELREVEAMESALLRRMHVEEELARVQGEQARLIKQIGDAEGKLAGLQKQYAEEAKKAEKEKYEARRDYAKKGLDALKKALDEAKKKEQEYVDEIKSLSEQQLGARESTDAKIRELQRRDMPEAQQQEDIRREAEGNLNQAIVDSYQEGADPEKIRATAEAVQQLAGQLKDTGDAVSLTERAGRLIERSYEQQKEAAKDSAAEQQAAQESIKTALQLAQEELAGYEAKLQELTGAPKTVQLQTEITEAESQLKRFKAELDAIPETKVVKLRTELAAANADLKATGYATGGQLPGYGGGDRRLILAEDGEFIVRKEAVRRYGSGLLAALNGLRLPAVGAVPRYASGGQVGGGTPLVFHLDGQMITATASGDASALRRAVARQRRKTGGRR